ncbi:MAG: cobalamin-dependent protein [bacterium]
MAHKLNTKKIKVLFISPKVRNNKESPPHFPLGIAYVAAYLRKKEIIVKAIDLNINDIEDKILNIAKFCDYIGISAFATAQINNGYHIAQTIKTKYPNIKIVYGGYHTTAKPEEAFKVGYADYVIRGHGEIPFYKLITGADKKIIPGLTYFENGKFSHNPINSFIDLNKLPFPALDLFKLRKYQDDVHVMPYAKHTAIDVKSSMGCPNRCSYCSAPLIYQQKIYYKTPEYVFYEINYYIKRFKIRYFHFEDENWLVDRKRIERFCDLIIKNNIKIKYAFMSSINVMYNNLDLINKLKKSGCVCIDLGLETADENVQKNIHKSNDLKQLIKVDSVLKDNRIFPFILIMSFNVGETLNSLTKTTKFMLKLKKTDLETIEYLKTNSSPYGFGQFATPHVGTVFYKNRKKNGIFIAEKNYDLHVWTKPSFLPYSFLNDIPKIIKKFTSKQKLANYLKKFESDLLRYFDNNYINQFWTLYKNIDSKKSVYKNYLEKFNNMNIEKYALMTGMMAKLFIICSKKIIQKYVVIASHPDDEFIGCFNLFKSGLVNKVIVVTDGGIQTIRKTLPDNKYIEKRKNESVNFITRYGLNKNQIHFLELPDGGLKNIKTNNIVKSISKYIKKDDIICSPSILEKHLDHKKLAEAINKFSNKQIYYSVITDIPNSKKIFIRKEKKLKLFKKYYPSQYWRLVKNNFPWRDYEEYSKNN